MAIDPTAIGAVTEPHTQTWTERDTMLYALGVGAGTGDLAYTTENSHDIAQQVLPTFAVICCMGFAAASKVGTFNWGMLLHGSQEIRLYKPLPAAGSLSVVSEVADIQDKGPGKNAILMMRGRGTDPATGELVAETLATAVIRGEGGFGGSPASARRRRSSRTASPTPGSPRRPVRTRPCCTGCPVTATRCTAIRGSPGRWPASRPRSCMGCAPTGSPAGRCWPNSRATTRRS